MNHTEYYHLPQWEESDRILMKDFNDAMAGIDSALFQTTGTAEAAKQSAADAAQAAGNSAWAVQGALAKDQLFRLARNYYEYLISLPAMPWQIGVFYQTLGSSGGANVSGMRQFASSAWLGRSGNTLTVDSFRSTIKTISSMNHSGAALKFTFTPPCAGTLKSIAPTGVFQNGTIGQIPCTLRLYNHSSGVLEQSGTGYMNNFGTSGGGSFYFFLNTEMILRANITYRMEMTISTSYLVSDFTMDSTFADCLGVGTVNVPSGSVSYKMDTGETSGGGLVLVHYAATGTGGDLSLDWDGETLSPAITRSYTSGGQAMKEAEFRRTSAVPASSSLTLNASCGVGGELELFDWGAILI